MVGVLPLGMGKGCLGVLPLGMGNCILGVIQGQGELRYGRGEDAIVHCGVCIIYCPFAGNDISWEQTLLGDVLLEGFHW
ncbi:MAG: hypothetical protein ACK53Y_20655, partial [bacterium]